MTENIRQTFLTKCYTLCHDISHFFIISNVFVSTCIFLILFLCYKYNKVIEVVSASKISAAIVLFSPSFQQVTQNSVFLNLF